MTTRARIRPGRECAYFPSDAEAATGGGSAGDVFPATIVRTVGTAVNLHVLEPDGTTLALTGVLRGQAKGQYDLTGIAGNA